MKSKTLRRLIKLGSLMLVVVIVFMANSVAFAAVNKPFPQAGKWTAYGVTPKVAYWNGSSWESQDIPQADQNQAVISYFESWDSHFYKTYSSQGHSDVGYIEGHVTGTVPEWGTRDPEPVVSASEHTGYGMIIYALMDGYLKDGVNDVDCKARFDSLVRLYNLMKIDGNLMCWAIPETYWTTFSAQQKWIQGWDDNGDPIEVYDYPALSSSATDGDMDIAYALLLADKQWGGNSPISGKTYKQLALDMINNGIYNKLINGTTNRILLGDWHSDCISWGDPLFTSYLTRSSDFMIDNLRAFKATASTAKQARFNNAINECYNIMEDFYLNHNSNTGLLSDFITKVGSDNSAPAPQSVYDDMDEPFPSGAYSENSCRLPFRLAQDYIHNGGGTTGKTTGKYLNALNAFITPKIAGSYKPVWDNSRDGYWINGSLMDWSTPGGSERLGTHTSYDALQFTSCFVSAGIVGSALNLGEGFAYIDNMHAYYQGTGDPYFKDTLTLLNMLLISRNWWKPY